MGLLGVPHQSRFKYDTYRYFIDLQRWMDLKKMFLQEASSLFHIETTPMLQNMI